jgi:putative FmdB family regulatory protein
MPIYEYQCDSCGRIEEALQRFSDRPLTTCKHCSGKLHKLISQSAFHLKGTGWYVTDYAGKTNQASKKSDDKSDQTSNAADAKPADSKKSAGDD